MSTGWNVPLVWYGKTSRGWDADGSDSGGIDRNSVSRCKPLVRKVSPGGLAIGAGSDANGGGLALEGGDTEGGGGFADDGSTHPRCDIVVDHECFNEPGVRLVSYCR